MTGAAGKWKWSSLTVIMASTFSLLYEGIGRSK